MSEFVGGTWALLADLLVAPGEEVSAASPLVERAAFSGHDFANLFGLPGSSRLVAALPPNALRLVERLEAPVLDLSAGWDIVYDATLSSKARKRRRRWMRQLEALGTVEASLARTHEELEPALEDAFRDYASRWQDRRDVSGFVTPTGRRFHRAALLRLADLDVPRLVTIRVDGQAIAFALAWQLSGRTYGLTRAFDPAYARFSPGSEAKLLSLEAATGEGIVRAEFLGAAGAPQPEVHRPDSSRSTRESAWPRRCEAALPSRRFSAGSASAGRSNARVPHGSSTTALSA